MMQTIALSLYLVIHRNSELVNCAMYIYNWRLTHSGALTETYYIYLYMADDSTMRKVKAYYSANKPCQSTLNLKRYKVNLINTNEKNNNNKNVMMNIRICYVQKLCV